MIGRMMTLTWDPPTTSLEARTFLAAEGRLSCLHITHILKALLPLQRAVDHAS